MCIMCFRTHRARKIYFRTSYPFGPVLSVFRRGQCFGTVNVPVWLIFEVPQGMSLASTLNISMLFNKI